MSTTNIRSVKLEGQTGVINILLIPAKRPCGESCSEEKEEVAEEKEGEASEARKAGESDPSCHFKKEIRIEVFKEKIISKYGHHKLVVD